MYIILLLCGALAYVTYGLQETLCPDSIQNFPYSTVVDGERRPFYRENPRVYGTIYDMDTLKEFFASKGLNLTNDYENMEIGSIFDGDTKGSCSGFDQGSTTTLGDCKLDSPYGKLVGGGEYTTIYSYYSSLVQVDQSQPVMENAYRLLNSNRILHLLDRWPLNGLISGLKETMTSAIRILSYWVIRVCVWCV